ncbi:MAG TPA: hypothetical protein PKY56_00140 [Candidatus Kapabacteria bacterium]|nr:hypothetical protein [Candidatus Kapabacteria bacterium]
MRNNQLKIGKEVEKEHKPTFDFIREFFEETGELPSEELFYSHIAQDHLVEISDYYDRLEEMEQEAKEENSIEKCITTSELPNLLKNTIIITDFQKAIMEIDFDDIEKARSVRKDTSKLIKKIITNKAGKKQTVWAIAYEEPKKESSGVDGAIEKLQHRISINEKILSARDNSSSTNNEMFVRVQKENDELNKKLNELKEQKKKLEIRKETKKKISESKGEKMFDKIADSQKLDKPMNEKDFWWQLSKQEKNEYLAITRRKNPDEIRKFKERVLGIKSEPKVEEKPEKVVEEKKKLLSEIGKLEYDRKKQIQVNGFVNGRTLNELRKKKKELEEITNKENKEDQGVVKGSLSKQEVEVLEKIMSSDYYNGIDDRRNNGSSSPVWDYSVYDYLSFKGKERSGVLSQMQQKGLIVITEKMDKNDIAGSVYITKKGFEELEKMSDEKLWREPGKKDKEKTERVGDLTKSEFDVLKYKVVGNISPTTQLPKGTPVSVKNKKGFVESSSIERDQFNQPIVVHKIHFLKQFSHKQGKTEKNPSGEVYRDIDKIERVNYSFITELEPKEEPKETPKKIKLSPFAINQKLTAEGVAVSSKIADEDDNLILNYTSEYKITDSLKNRMRAKLNSMGFKKIQVTDSNIIIDNSENNIEKAE